MATRLSLALVWAALFLLGLALDARAQEATVSVKIQAINDLHGGIEEGRRLGNRAVGGAAYLAAHMKARAQSHPNVLVVSAGDMVGASPPVSALLQDEPTIRVMNALGVRVNTPGNHEFDEGIDEFFRLTHGGCHTTTGCFEGSKFRQISANVVVEATGEPLLPPYSIENVDGVPIGFIGATHPDVAQVVTAGAVAGLSFHTAATTINRYVAELQSLGVRAIVVLIHDGGERRSDGRIGGPFIQTVEALDPEVDLVISAHTHQGYATRINGKLVTQAFSYGSAFADIDLTIDRQTGDVVSSWADIITTHNSGVTPDPEIAAIVAQAEAKVGPLVTRQVGTAARTITAEQNRAGETALGNLIADAQRWKTGAQIAVTNPGGIRAPFPAGSLTWGQVFAAQPFSNQLVTMDLSGGQIRSLLELQWSEQADGGERYRPLQLSGLRVIWDGARPRGQRVVSLMLDDGAPVESNVVYRVTANSFLAGGGDGFGIFGEGSRREYGQIDLAALVEYVEQIPQPVDARVEGRIMRLD